jgi:O-antigen/teichoic acid export membrane protein
MGPGYEQSAEILKILIVPAAIYFPNAIGNSVLYAIERHRTILYLNLAEGIINLTLSIILVQKIGLLGVVYGTIISQVIIYFFVMPVVVAPILKFNLRHFYFSILKAASWAFGMTTGLAYLWRTFLTPENWGKFIIIALIAGGGAFVTGYYLTDRKDLNLIRNRLLS